MASCFVYTPAVTIQIQKTVSVLYLQHGSLKMKQDGHTGKANLILETLLLKKRLPMIIVMDNGYANNQLIKQIP